jgi:hypothetical protein
MILGVSVAMAKNTSANITTVVDNAAIRRISFPSVELNSSLESGGLLDLLSEKLLVEQARFLEESLPLLQLIKANWSVLVAELAKESPEGLKTARLQNELSILDTRLAGKRLEHLLAVEKIKAESESRSR